MRRERKKRLTGPWRNMHGAVWLIGLAILFFTGKWWPGILVLVALSMILEAALQFVVPEAFVEENDEGEVKDGTLPAAAPASSSGITTAPEHRLELLPSECPKCGAPVKGEMVKWTGPQSADCPYCGANLPMKSGEK